MNTEAASIIRLGRDTKRYLVAPDSHRQSLLMSISRNQDKYGSVFYYSGNYNYYNTDILNALFFFQFYCKGFFGTKILMSLLRIGKQWGLIRWLKRLWSSCGVSGQ
ncbi:hypothetical protein GDO78_016476 [Eleutherodactylus coqui]|uniref:Uncharacterized protein n=1 Tax=Eleutherodactylus coqui TaxID=57060 RepID=A0A8J6BFG1_ELECQ|nr:hypothetical protein GDO78_016476 [Eleutherodactylus coqui]